MAPVDRFDGLDTLLMVDRELEAIVWISVTVTVTATQASVELSAEID